MFTPAKYLLPAFLFTALGTAAFIGSAYAAAPAWQVQQASMTYQNSGLPNPAAVLAGATAQIGFDPKKPEDGQFRLSFSTTGLFLPRAAMATRDPDKLRDIAMPAGEGTLTATRMERKGDNIGVSGTLTLNGQSRPVILNMGVAEDANETARSLRLTGQFTINRPSFATKEMGYVGPANVPVKFDILAIAQITAPVTETAAQATPPATEPGAAQNTQQKQNSAPPSRRLTEEADQEQKEESPDIGVVRTFGGDATSASPSAPQGQNTQNGNSDTPEIGTVRTFGGSP